MKRKSHTQQKVDIIEKNLKKMAKELALIGLELLYKEPLIFETIDENII